MILLAALCWAMSILYVRAHRWISTPFQLVFWEALLAAATLSTLALCIDGAPRVVWTPALTAALLYAGVIGTALGYWAMAMVSRSVSAVTASLGVLATPVIGVAVSAAVFGEVIDLPLVVAMAMILGGIAIGVMPARSSRQA